MRPSSPVRSPRARGGTSYRSANGNSRGFARLTRWVKCVISQASPVTVYRERISTASVGSAFYSNRCPTYPQRCAQFKWSLTQRTSRCSLKHVPRYLTIVFIGKVLPSGQFAASANWIGAGSANGPCKDGYVSSPGSKQVTSQVFR